MDPQTSLIAQIGLVMQGAGAAALVMLFLLVRQHLHRRDYFVAWGDGFVALLAGLVALSLNFTPLAETVGAFVTHYAYLTGKIAYYGLLFAGTVMYVRGTPHPRFRWVAFGFALVWAGLALGLARSVNYYVAWQSPFAATVLGLSGWLLLTLPEPRRTLGSRVTGVTFVISATVWTSYFFVYTTLAPDWLRAVAPFNSYLDLMLQTILAFGMVLILLEDARRETDAAHAELALAHDQLLTESFRDALTGTLNRRAFTEGVGLENAKSTFGCVLALDLDNLKDINDRLGHHAGDDLLKHLVAELRLSLRASDKIYRMGGDEFLVVMPRARAEHAAPRLDLLLKQAPRLKLADQERGIRLKASLGAADYSSDADMANAVKDADRRMYEEKRRRKESGELDTHPRGKLAPSS
jgi:diguanylate cyclase (GGDEF)-like protein